MSNSTQQETQPQQTQSLTSPETQTTQVDPRPPQNSSFRNPVLLILVLAVGLLLGAVGLYAWQNYFLNSKSPPPENQNTQQPKDISPTEAGQQTRQTFINNKFIYITKNNLNIGMFDTATQEGSFITQDAGSVNIVRTVWYDSPVFIKENLIGFTRCEREGETTSDPYTCSLTTQNLETGKREVITTNQSQANTSGYQAIGEISNVSFSRSGNYAAYTSSSAIDTGAQRVVYVQDLSQNQQPHMFLFSATPGRGGMPDEDNSLHFSQDEKYLLVNSTWSVPSETGITMAVIDLSQTPPKKTYESPENVLTTLGRWLGNNQIIAKQLADTGVASNLISINPKTGETTILKENVSDWHGFTPVEDNDANFIFYSTQGDREITVKNYDASTQVQTEISRDILPLKADSNLIAARSTVSCESQGHSCGPGNINFLIPEGFAVYNVEREELQEFNQIIPEPGHEFDVWLNKN